MRALIGARRCIVRHLGLVLAIVSSVGLAMPQYAGAAAFGFRDFALGAVGAFSTCAAQPNGDQLCEDLDVEYFASGPNSQQGLAVFVHYRAFIHPDGTATELFPEVGFGDVTGSYDNSRLTFASMSGVTLDLNDFDPSTGELTPNGRIVVLGPFDWVAASGVYVFGNDGPFGEGLPRHITDLCVTQNYNTQQRFTTAHVTGTINGVSVA